MKGNKIYILTLTIILIIVTGLSFLFYYKYKVRVEYLSKLENRIENLQYLSTFNNMHKNNIPLNEKFEVVSSSSESYWITETNSESAIGYVLTLENDTVRQIRSTKVY